MSTGSAEASTHTHLVCLSLFDSLMPQRDSDAHSSARVMKPVFLEQLGESAAKEVSEVGGYI